MQVDDPEIVLDAVPTGVIVLDADGRLAACNRHARALLGARWPIGQSVSDAFSTHDGDRGILRVQPGDDSTALRYRRARLPDGRTVVQLESVGPGEVERTEREQRIRYETVADVLPSLLHDLRNPLAAISSAVELLLEDAPTAAMRGELEEILVEVHRMDLGFQGTGVVGRHLRSGRAQMVDQAVADVVRLMRSSAVRSGVILRFEAMPMPLLPLDQAVVRAVVYNLVDNALAACSAGDEIRVRTWVADDHTWRLVVHDTGRGMPPEVLARCTDLFFSTRSHGSGIGLPMCRRVVHDASGTLTVLSSVGRGTRVGIEVPLRRDPRDRGAVS